MRGPHNIWRLIRTGATLERTGAMGVVLDAFDAPAHLRLTAHILGWPFKWLGLKGDLDMPPAPRALTALGPAYIKFGQVLSTRPDVVGDELAKQLTVLQDKLPPFSTEIAKQSIAQELGENADVIFSDFSPAVAAASIAQVHRATLRQSGEEVAVKVLRPDIERAFRTDLDAFFSGGTDRRSAVTCLAPLAANGCHHAFRKRCVRRVRPAIGKLCCVRICRQHRKG